MAGFNTPSGGVSVSGRRQAKQHGDTMPGTDKFPIRNASDLEKAKHDIGRTTEPKAKVRGWINKRAKELGKPGLGEQSEDKGERRKKVYDHPRSGAVREKD
jgi:hypothetical protein